VDVEVMRQFWYEFIKSLEVIAVRVWGEQVDLILPGLEKAATEAGCHNFLRQSHPSWVCYWSPYARFYGRFM
jgi:hypothetical protein